MHTAAKHIKTSVVATLTVALAIQLRSLILGDPDWRSFLFALPVLVFATTCVLPFHLIAKRHTQSIFFYLVSGSVLGAAFYGLLADRVIIYLPQLYFFAAIYGSATTYLFWSSEREPRAPVIEQTDVEVVHDSRI